MQEDRQTTRNEKQVERKEKREMKILLCARLLMCILVNVACTEQWYDKKKNDKTMKK